MLRVALRERVGRLRLVDLKGPGDLAPGEEATVADIRNLDRLTQTFAEADGVIHLAGISDEADFHDLAETNIVGTYHVLEASRRNGVRRIVYASSNRATGFYDVDDLVTDELPPRPDGFYGVSKVAAETLCRLYHDKFGLAIACLRLGSFESAPSTTRHLSTWLSPGDAARAFVAAMTADVLEFGVCYVASNNSQGWWDLGAARRLIGYEPQDSADVYFDELERRRVRSPAPQGGAYASAEYSLKRMRE